jgi:hypothetical protein
MSYRINISSYPSAIVPTLNEGKPHHKKLTRRKL